MITVRALSKLVEDWSREIGQPVSWHELVSVRRSRAVCRARSLLIWLARRHTSLSLPQIGRQMGGRDHTTILHNCRVIETLLDKGDPPTCMALARIEASIPSSLEAEPLETAAPPPNPHRVIAYAGLVDAVEAVLVTADAAALARGTRQARAADLALSHALASLRAARKRVLFQEPVARIFEPTRRAKPSRAHGRPARGDDSVAPLVADPAPRCLRRASA